MKVKVISLPYILQVLYVLCFSRPRYQVSVYRTIGPLVIKILSEYLVQSELSILPVTCNVYTNDSLHEVCFQTVLDVHWTSCVICLRFDIIILLFLTRRK